MPLNIYPKPKSKTLKLLRTFDDATAIANTVAPAGAPPSYTRCPVTNGNRQYWPGC